MFLLIGLALGWLLHEFAASGARDVGPLRADVVIGLANAGEYLLPMFCAVLAGLSVRRGPPIGRQRPAARGTAPDFKVIEPLVRIALLQRGFSLVDGEAQVAAGIASPADMPEIRLRRQDGEAYLLCWRHLDDGRVGASAVHWFMEDIRRSGAFGGFLISSGGFTSEACAMVRGRELHLVDGPRLMRWLDGVRAARPDAGAAHASLRQAGAGNDKPPGVAVAVAVAARNGRAATRGN